ncbi:MAG: substrate-binding domain-containing protein [Lachnospiraceae bacterium]|nr:substrate-binding domain-containing protein [Lachnospiraceae bacterium]
MKKRICLLTLFLLLSVLAACSFKKSDLTETDQAAGNETDEASENPEDPEALSKEIESKKEEQTTELIEESAEVKQKAEDKVEAERDAIRKEKLIDIGLIQRDHSSDWILEINESFNEIFSEENGYDLNFIDCENNYEKQLAALDSVIDENVDCIVLNPVEEEGYTEILERCEAAGIPVVLIDNKISDCDLYKAWIGSDRTKTGRAAGEWLKAYADREGKEEIKIVEIPNEIHFTGMREIKNGFTEIADKYKMSILEQPEEIGEGASAKDLMESYCSKYKDEIDVLVCYNDAVLNDIIDAMDEKGLGYGDKGDLIIISFGASKNALRMVTEGIVTAEFGINKDIADRVEKTIINIFEGKSYLFENYLKDTWYALDENMVSFEIEGETQKMMNPSDWKK